MLETSFVPLSVLLQCPPAALTVFFLVCLLQKDSHTVYLEQELESLKVVLEMKNNQLHQKEKKLMEMDKLVSVSIVPIRTTGGGSL